LKDIGFFTNSFRAFVTFSGIDLQLVVLQNMFFAKTDLMKIISLLVIADSFS
jgi:hypothetical protein